MNWANVTAGLSAPGLTAVTIFEVTGDSTLAYKGAMLALVAAVALNLCAMALAAWGMFQETLRTKYHHRSEMITAEAQARAMTRTTKAATCRTGLRASAARERRDAALAYAAQIGLNASTPLSDAMEITRGKTPQRHTKAGTGTTRRATVTKIHPKRRDAEKPPA